MTELVAATFLQHERSFNRFVATKCLSYRPNHECAWLLSTRVYD